MPSSHRSFQCIESHNEQCCISQFLSSSPSHPIPHPACTSVNASTLRLNWEPIQEGAAPQAGSRPGTASLCPSSKEGTKQATVFWLALLSRSHSTDGVKLYSLIPVLKRSQHLAKLPHQPHVSPSFPLALKLEHPKTSCI